jgi:alpha-methylacyl-CoA racemase
MAGPLAGIKVVELQGRGPGPFGTMVLADLGAEVVTIARTADVVTDDGTPVERLFAGRRRHDLATRGKRSVAIDLKQPEGLETALQVIDGADVLTEGNRPGVAERLGLGPEVCLARNPRLIYARVTGWGQEGPQASRPGHDIDYIALAGALEHLRRPGQPPMPPLNLLGDYGGGGMLLAVGVLAALVERARSGRGQVVDVAMVDGIALLNTLFFGLRAEGLWNDDPASNVLDLGAPHYNVYETADGRYVAVGAGEAPFYAELVRRLGLDPQVAAEQQDPSTWAANREHLAAAFRTRTLAEWRELLEDTDTCFAPVLTMEEATTHPHLAHRETFVEVDGVVQPAPAPRFGRTPATAPGRPTRAGEHTVEVLRASGLDAEQIDALLRSGAVARAAEPPITPR